MLHRGNLGVIVVCYDTGEGFGDRLAKYVKISEKIVVVINAFSSIEHQKSFLNSLKIRFAKQIQSGEVELVLLDENVGIARALNIGISNIIHSCEWIAFFDDDSTLICGDVNDLSEEVIEAIRFSGGKGLGILGLGYSSDTDLTFSVKPEGFHEKYGVITSGSIMNRRTLIEFGSFHDDYFIDSVDIEYSLRVKRANRAVIKSRRQFMIHPIGTRYTVNVIGVRMSFSEHNSIRCYYISRNRILLARKYARDFPIVVTYAQIQTLMHVLRILAFEEDKIGKLVQITRGIVHGLIGKAGKLAVGGAP